VPPHAPIVAGERTDVAVIRLVQPLALNAKDADRALDRLLAATRDGAVSSIGLGDLCLLRMIRRHDVPRSRECVVTWQPFAAGGCSFIGSLSIVDEGPYDAPALVLEGTDARLDQANAETIGRAVLEYIAAELTTRSVAQRFMRNTAPMLHAASAKRARMG
jgi:hypothetical protein